MIKTNCHGMKRGSPEWLECKSRPAVPSKPTTPVTPPKTPKAPKRDRNTLSPTTPAGQEPWQQAITAGIGVIADTLGGVVGNQRATDLALQNLEGKKGGSFSLTNPDGGPNFIALAALAVGGYFVWKWLK